MSETVLWGITGVSLGIAGTVGVFVLVMSAQLAKMGLRIRNEEKDRKRQFVSLIFFRLVFPRVPKPVFFEWSKKRQI